MDPVAKDYRKILEVMLHNRPLLRIYHRISLNGTLTIFDV